MLLLSLGFWFVLASFVTGCVKSVDLWGFKTEFYPGFDVSAGANAVDRVDDRRGVSAFKDDPAAQ
jgi:hypothetical protein